MASLRSVLIYCSELMYRITMNSCGATYSQAIHRDKKLQPHPIKTQTNPIPSPLHPTTFLRYPYHPKNSMTEASDEKPKPKTPFLTQYESSWPRVDIYFLTQIVTSSAHACACGVFNNISSVANSCTTSLYSSTGASTFTFISASEQAIARSFIQSCSATTVIVGGMYFRGGPRPGTSGFTAGWSRLNSFSGRNSFHARMHICLS
jgi:hypothetical protein